MVDVSLYSKDALTAVKACNFLCKEDLEDLVVMREELQDTFEKKQIWRTETEMRVSVLNDIKHPTNASKYWQAVREQSVFFENLITLSFDYRRKLVQIKRIKAKMEVSEGLDLEELEIDLEEAMFEKKNMEVASKDRMRELKLWSKIKSELDDGSFDNEDVDSHQLVSYTQRFMNEAYIALNNGANPAEQKNLASQLNTSLSECEKKGVFNDVIRDINPRVAEALLPKLGFSPQITA